MQPMTVPSDSGATALRGSRSAARALAGVGLGLGAYLVVSLLAWYAPATTASTLRLLVVGAALVLCAAGLALVVKRGGRVFGMSVAVTLLLVSAIVLISPVPGAFVQRSFGLLAVMQVGARTFIAPVLAGVLGVLAWDLPRRARG